MRRDPCPEVQQRGRMWLEELFNSLENELDTEIAKTATRRSAGLPFIVQVIFIIIFNAYFYILEYKNGNVLFLALFKVSY